MIFMHCDRIVTASQRVVPEPRHFLDYFLNFKVYREGGNGLHARSVLGYLIVSDFNSEWFLRFL
jgi:hypothetical protein